MPTEFSTALYLDGESLDWTRLECVRGTPRDVAQGRLDWPAEPAGDTDEPPGAGIPPDPAVLARRLAPCGPPPFTLCLDSSEVLFRTLTLPTMDRSEIDSMVELQLDKVLPLPVEDMTIAHETLAIAETHTLVLACAVPTTTIDRAAQRLGLSAAALRRVDIAPLAFARLLAAHDAGQTPALEGREAVLLEEGAELTLMVLQDGLLLQARALGPRTLPWSELLRALRLTMLQVEAEQGVRELQRLTLVGEQPAEWNLDTRLAETFQCAVRLLTTETLGTLSRGAALRSAEGCTFDLTPVAWRTGLAASRFRRRLLHALAAGLLLWAVLTLTLFGGPVLMEKRAERIENEISRLDPAAQAVRDLRHRVRMIQTYMDRTRSPLEMLREISALLPEGIDLSSFRYRREDGRLWIQGTARSTPLVYTFKQRVDATDLFDYSALVSGPTTNPRTRGADFELLMVFPAEGEDP